MLRNLIVSVISTVASCRNHKSDMVTTPVDAVVKTL